MLKNRCFTSFFKVNIETVAIHKIPIRTELKAITALVVYQIRLSSMKSFMTSLF